MDTVDEQLRQAVADATAAGWSVCAMAKGAGVPQPTLQRWLSGARADMTLRSFVKLATWFGMRLTKPKVPRRPR